MSFFDDIGKIPDLIGKIPDVIEKIPDDIEKISGDIKNLPLTTAFNLLLSSTWNRENTGHIPGYEDINFTSGDNCNLSGWIYRTPGQDNHRGTVFLLHGFCDNSLSMKWVAEGLSQNYNITALAFDHRYHGNSSKGHHFPTFGGQEAYDVEAAMDYADKIGLPKPYILYGVSLGGMSGQKAGLEDKRVSGVFMLSVPGWPWHAIGINAYIATPVANLINDSYNWDILRSGDIRTLSQPWDHRPLVCYLMGDKDRYDIYPTMTIFKHWHNGESGGYDISIKDNLGINKFFYRVNGAIHPDVPGYQVWDWDRFHLVKSEFFNRILK